MADKKQEAPPKASVVTYTYLGMSKKASEAWLKEMQRLVKVPSTLDYKIKKNDNPSTVRHKQAKTKKFLANRAKEIQDRLERNQMSKTLGGVCFEKDVPVAVDSFVCETVIEDENFQPQIVKEKMDPKPEFLAKLDALVIQGVFKREPELTRSEADIRAVLNPERKRRD